MDGSVFELPVGASKLECAFYSTQHLRDELQTLLDAKSFIALLRCSWTLYASFGERCGTTLTKNRRLSPLFARRLRELWETDVKEFCRHCFATIGPNGYPIAFKNHVDCVRIDMHSWKSVTIKRYSGQLACEQQWRVVGCAQTEKSVAQIIFVLRHLGMIDSDGLLLAEAFSSALLDAFTQQRLIDKFADQLHREYLAQKGILSVQIDK